MSDFDQLGDGWPEFQDGLPVALDGDPALPPSYTDLERSLEGVRRGALSSGALAVGAEGGINRAADFESGIQAVLQAKENCRRKLVALYISSLASIYILQQDGKGCSFVEEVSVRLNDFQSRFYQTALLTSSSRESGLSENERLLKRLSIENASILLGLEELLAGVGKLTMWARVDGDNDQLISLQQILDGIGECINILKAN
ncbi:MAG: hypothetical protein WCT53_02765 [Candidatus Gracilibacteria bacterium]